MIDACASAIAAVARQRRPIYIDRCDGEGTAEKA
jgi:hypothetical protein